MRYIYGLCDPGTKELRYVGVSRDPYRRWTVHLRSTTGTHKGNWIYSLRQHDKRPELIIIETVDDPRWAERERYWIAYYRSIGAKLTNATDGGEGTLNLSPESRKKLSNALKGRKVSESTRRAISESNKRRMLTDEMRRQISERFSGKPGGNLGKHPSEESRQRRSVAMKGNKNLLGHYPSEETRYKISKGVSGKNNGMYGKSHSEESKQKMRDAKVGRHASVEARNKMSKSRSGNLNHNFGKHLSPETRQKLSGSLKRYYNGLKTESPNETLL